MHPKPCLGGGDFLGANGEEGAWQVCIKGFREHRQSYLGVTLWSLMTDRYPGNSPAPFSPSPALAEVLGAWDSHRDQEEAAVSPCYLYRKGAAWGFKTSFYPLILPTPPPSLPP